MLIGLWSVGHAVLVLFTALGRRPPGIPRVPRCAVGTDDFLLALGGVINSPVQDGGRARLLDNGDAFFPAMLDAIRSAERSVNFTTYIWKDGEVSDRFVEALAERARAGVEVRLLIDALGGIDAPSEGIERLRAAGARWEWFHPLRFGRLTRAHRRNHRRALVVDGRIGFTGGASIMDKWLGNAEGPHGWRDCMIEVHGPLAVSLQSTFTQLWAATTGEVLAGPAYYPTDPDAGPPAEDTEPIRRHVNVVSSPSAEAHPMRHVFWLTILSARERVYITNPYFVPDELLLEALKERAGAGVDVRVLVPNEHNDVFLVRWASHGYYETLLEAGVRIYEYQPTMIHQKLLVADGAWSIVGSVNMDVRSKQLNQENALGLADEELAAELERTFFHDLDSAVEIDLDRWRRRPLWRRGVERFFRIFEEQF